MDKKEAILERRGYLDITYYNSNLENFRVDLSKNKEVYRLQISEDCLLILSCQDDRIKSLYKEVQEKVDAYIKETEGPKLEDAINRLEAELEKE